MSVGSRFGGVDGGVAGRSRAEDKWLWPSPLSAEMTPLHVPYSCQELNSEFRENNLATPLACLENLLNV